MGMKLGRGDLKEGLAEVMRAVVPANRLVKRFEADYGTRVCRGISAMEVNEEMMKILSADPETALRGLDPRMVGKCSKIFGKTAEKVIEILEDEG